MEQENLQQAEELNNNEAISPDTLNDETQNEVSVQGQPTPIEKAPEKEVPNGIFLVLNLTILIYIHTFTLILAHLLHYHLNLPIIRFPYTNKTQNQLSKPNPFLLHLPSPNLPQPFSSNTLYNLPHFLPPLQQPIHSFSLTYQSFPHLQKYSNHFTSTPLFHHPPPTPLKLPKFPP